MSRQGSVVCIYTTIWSVLDNSATRGFGGLEGCVVEKRKGEEEETSKSRRHQPGPVTGAATTYYGTKYAVGKTTKPRSIPWFIYSLWSTPATFRSHSFVLSSRNLSILTRRLEFRYVHTRAGSFDVAEVHSTRSSLQGSKDAHAADEFLTHIEYLRFDLCRSLENLRISSLDASSECYTIGC